MSVSLGHILQIFAGKIEVDKPAWSALIKLMMTYPIECEFTELINHVQHHTCGSYCLHKKKTSHSDRDDGDDIPDGAPAEDHPMECKFGFPQPE